MKTSNYGGPGRVHSALPIRLLFVGALVAAIPQLGADVIAAPQVEGHPRPVRLLLPNLPLNLNLPALRAAVDLPPAVLGRYVGCYRFSDTDVLTVTQEGSHLYGHERGLERVELFARNEYRFFLKVVDAQVEFVPGVDGPATAAIWRQGGRTERGERILDLGAPASLPADSSCRGANQAPSFVPVHPRVIRILTT